MSTALRLAPQEFHVLNDRYVIRTRVPKEHVTDEAVLTRAHHANLGAGDAVTVQVMSHNYDQLLYEAEYRVVSRGEEMQRHNIGERNERMAMETTLRIERKGEWWASSLVIGKAGETPAEPKEPKPKKAA